VKTGDLVKVKEEYSTLNPEENPYGIIVEVEDLCAQAVWIYKGNAILGILTHMEYFEIISEA